MRDKAGEDFATRWAQAVARILRKDVKLIINRENVREARPAPWLWASRNDTGRTSSRRVLSKKTGRGPKEVRPIDCEAISQSGAIPDEQGPES